MFEFLFEFLFPMLFEFVAHARGWMIAAAVALGAAPGLVCDSTGWAWTGGILSGLAGLLVAAADGPALPAIIGGGIGMAIGAVADNSVWMWVGGLIGFWVAGLSGLAATSGNMSRQNRMP